ncbi:MAG: hypothetical protein UEP57_00690 [Oscillospiraceae bacterium]|nr:hypothetical protein [Oscillospiraceae bacterium]
MKIDIKMLDVLFRRVPAEEVLGKLLDQQALNGQTANESCERWFRRFAADDFSGFSDDELTLIFEEARQQTDQWKVQASLGGNADSCAPCISLPALALSSIGKLADQMLCLSGQEPRCQINQVLDWREAFLRLGQDLFVCAFLAKEDIRSRCARTHFSWPAIIRTDCVPLNDLLERGLAENHQHLYGSSQTFALSWLDLMNYPEDHEVICGEIGFLRQPVSIDSGVNPLLTLSEKLRTACMLRLYLFLDAKDPTASPPGRLRRALREYPMLRSLKTDLSYARSVWGAGVPQSNGRACILDYAMTHELFALSAEEPYRALCSERAFLYHCFRKYYEGSMDTTEQWSFYLYILLKLQLRSELIQVNQRVGFENFSIYQSRKGTVSRQRSCYEEELIRMALSAPLRKENVVSLETRVSPKKTPQEDHALIIDRIERLRRFSEHGRGDPFDPEMELDSDPNVFYVFHFIKGKDKQLAKEQSLLVTCRHAQKRAEVRTQALAIAQAVCAYEDLRLKVCGIDSAANEIGCPPEIFANAYRFLRNVRRSAYLNPLSEASAQFNTLHATYHAGEDFLDIAGALRSIDEAVEFLELERGDRIGHALGLGVWPSIHYGLKSNRVFLRKQDRLDDLVWLLYRGRELGAKINPDLYGRLKKEAETLLMEIYRSVFETERQTITLTDYHCIMQLRGDDPACYRTGRFVPHLMPATQYEEYAVSYRSDARNAYRENPIFAGFYYHYHYNHAVKIAGHAVCSVQITQDYMELIESVQDCLQRDLREKGIIIECNPSSNVLIGTFRDYGNHPVFRFHQPDPKQKGGDMLVCVNTDDLGVFDTSLEFEYALLFQTLKEKKKADGSARFSEKEILDYLEHLRKMGHWAAFRPAVPACP